MPTDPLYKAILDNQKLILSLSKENKEIKKTLKILEKKVQILETIPVQFILPGLLTLKLLHMRRL